MATPFQHSPFQQQSGDAASAAQVQRAPRRVAETTYSPREASEAISDATLLQRQRDRLQEDLAAPRAGDERLSMEQVLEIADELGIARQDVLAALERRQRPPRGERFRAGRRRLSDTLYRWHVAAYASAVAGSTVIDVLLTDGWDIAVVTSAGWGILVGTHTLGRLFARRGVFARDRSN